jgi:hypothetical protein
MRLAEGFEKTVGVCDIETYKECFYVGCLNPDTGDWIDFEISAYKNQLYEFVKWYMSKPFDLLVTFNGINFDQQVLEWVKDEHQKWFDLTGLEIARVISDRGSRVIEDSNYGIQPRYKEKDFSIPPLDVFRIHHFDNEAKRTSLKWCANMLNMDVEETPVPFDKEGMTEEDIIDMKGYCFNDCKVTLGVLELTMGRVELEELSDYKGKNKIQDRLDVQRETGLKCLNWSDVKIGEEWNKLDYKIAERIRDDEERGLLFSKKIKHPFGQKFKNFFPSTMEFKTDELKHFVKEVGNHYVKAEKQEFHITIGNTRYTVAKGGLHSTEKNRYVFPPTGYNYDDIDVQSQYPNSIYKLRIFAPHLKDTIMTQFKGKIDKRIIYKDKANKLKKEGKIEEARPYSSVQDMLKLCLNGGYYGKLGQKGSFLEYPEGLLKCCMSNQIEILMLIEMMELEGFHVLSGNTDGATILYPENRKDRFLEICKEWEDKVGNIEMGKLEHTPFDKVWQESVNSYIALKKDGGVKKKGRFMTQFEMNKNKSKRVIPLALEAYFIEGKDPIEFIQNHKNIFDFCIAKKAFGQMYYEEQWTENGKVMTKRHKKLVRYFVSKEGTVLWKRGINNMGDPMNNQVNAPTDLGQPLITYFNKRYDMEDYNIDYDHYILETLERIDKIEKTKKAQSFVQLRKGGQQGSLF